MLHASRLIQTANTWLQEAWINHLNYGPCKLASAYIHLLATNTR